MEGWRVDPDRVVGVLAGVDEEGARLGQLIADAEALAFEGGSSLVVDGRTALAQAWEAFLDDRRLVPGKLIHAVTTCSAAVSEATVAVVAGDAEMAANGGVAAQYALREWDIDSVHAYMDDGF